MTALALPPACCEDPAQSSRLPELLRWLDLWPRLTGLLARLASYRDEIELSAHLRKDIGLANGAEPFDAQITRIAGRIICNAGCRRF